MAISPYVILKQEWQGRLATIAYRNHMFRLKNIMRKIRGCMDSGLGIMHRKHIRNPISHYPLHGLGKRAGSLYSEESTMKDTEIELSISSLDCLGPMLVFSEAQVKLGAVVFLGHPWSFLYWRYI